MSVHEACWFSELQTPDLWVDPSQEVERGGMLCFIPSFSHLPSPSVCHLGI